MKSWENKRYAGEEREREKKEEVRSDKRQKGEQRGRKSKGSTEKV